jgi:hypothetical protein
VVTAAVERRQNCLPERRGSGGGGSGSGVGEWGLETELPSATPFNTGRPPSFSGPQTHFTGQAASLGSVLDLFRPEPIFSPEFFGSGPFLVTIRVALIATFLLFSETDFNCSTSIALVQGGKSWWHELLFSRPKMICLIFIDKDNFITKMDLYFFDPNKSRHVEQCSGGDGLALWS